MSPAVKPAPSTRGRGGSKAAKGAGQRSGKAVTRAKKSRQPVGASGPGAEQATDGARGAARLGVAARKIVPRSSMGTWQPFDDRPDPVDILVQQGHNRLQDLLPVRYARMLVSPFTFYRGAAAVMAADLASTAHSGLQVQLCGDAHLANFGGFAAPDRTMVFDLNDFDETIPGPFEWDVKRLVASFAVAGRDRGFSPSVRRDLELRAVRSYRDAMTSFAPLPRIAVWYERLDADAISRRWGAVLGSKAVGRFEKAVAKAQSKTSSKAFARYTTRDAEGHLQLVSQPPLLVPLEELADGTDVARARAQAQLVLDTYDESLLPDRRWLLAGYRLVGVARKVVGVGSVGTRCWVALLVSVHDEQDALVLQVKEAGDSVLDRFLGTNTFTSQGERVVAGQRILQAAGDVLLGWTRVEALEGGTRDFYVRQLWDWKVSADLATLDVERLGIYAELCGWTLARAHARSGDRKAMAAYLGKSDTALTALADFSEAYADQNDRDYAALRKAAADGTIPVASTTEG